MSKNIITTLTILINSSAASFIAENPKFEKFKKEINAKNFFQKLFSYFLLNDTDELPIAALTALAENYPAAQGWWLRADPVELRADMSHVYLLGNEHLDFSEREIAQLVTEINEFLKQDNLKLLISQKNTWYLHLEKNPEIKTFPLSMVVGKVIANYLPQGKKAIYWQKLLTEIQMLLNMSPITKQRFLENKPIINSVWFWGGGKLPKVTHLLSWQKIYGNDDLTKGLALLTNVPYQNFNDNFSFLTEITKPGEYLIVDGRGVPLAISLLSSFGRASSESLRKLNAKIILDFTDGVNLEFNVNELYPWWRRFI